MAWRGVGFFERQVEKTLASMTSSVARHNRRLFWMSWSLGCFFIVLGIVETVRAFGRVDPFGEAEEAFRLVMMGTLLLATGYIGVLLEALRRKMPP